MLFSARDSEPIRLLKTPRSLSVYILNIYIYYPNPHCLGCARNDVDVDDDLTNKAHDFLGECISIPSQNLLGITQSCLLSGALQPAHFAILKLDSFWAIFKTKSC